mmetsp:Transcript_14764/g.30429  ORF Transcript_14764/g.30429 Transcript_14764/m.30429 type:complete len:402 (-) Transcript_14764:628-1833(-)
MGEFEGRPSKNTGSNKRKSKDAWRKYGAARRKELVAKDETLGGTSFEMHKKCQIERYFRISEKAIADFQAKCADPESDLEETYVMGHRLKAFLGQALPQHPHYRRSQVAQLRSKSLRNLAWIKDKMHEIALKIDEQQLDTYVTLDYEPEPDDISTSSSEPEIDDDDDDDDSAGFADFSSMSSFDDQEWHAFSGWGAQADFPDPGFDEKDVPLATETDSSSLGLDVGSSLDESENEEQPSDEHVDLSDIPSDTEEEPQTFVTFQDDEDDDASHDEQDLDGKSDFLRQIEDEAVCYESDSEAVDSWAQDGESHAHSIASSGTAMTYDPARIAFREIMSNVPKDRNHLYTRNSASARQGPAPPLTVPQLPPKSILTLKRIEHPRMDRWASLSRTTIGQEVSPAY